MRSFSTVIFLTNLASVEFIVVASAWLTLLTQTSINNPDFQFQNDPAVFAATVTMLSTRDNV